MRAGLRAVLLAPCPYPTGTTHTLGYASQSLLSHVTPSFPSTITTTITTSPSLHHAQLHAILPERHAVVDYRHASHLDSRLPPAPAPLPTTSSTEPFILFGAWRGCQGLRPSLIDSAYQQQWYPGLCAPANCPALQCRSKSNRSSFVRLARPLLSSGQFGTVLLCNHQDVKASNVAGTVPANSLFLWRTLRAPVIRGP